jgi:hypothetical protein
MTQDQYGQVRGPGYVVRGDVVPDDETEELPTGQSKPMTRFQKVASARRGGDPDQDEQDKAAADQGASATDPDDPAAHPPWVTRQDEAVAVASPDVPLPETGTDPLPRQDTVADQGRTDAEDHSETQPDMFGTATREGNGATSATYREGQAGAATIADVPATGVPATDVPAGTESRPGEAAGTLGDFSDLTYGNLIPDVALFTEQWRHVQFKFVDDPHAAVTEAADLIAQVTAKLEAAIQERQRAIEERQRAIQEQQRSLRGRWGEGTNADTEALRETLRMYRTFLGRLIGPRAG